MKLNKFLWYSLIYGEYPYEEIELEDIPFKVTKEDFENEDHYYNLCDMWWKAHGIREMGSDILDYDLEGSYLTRRVVFKYDNKYYAFRYQESPYWKDDGIIDSELKEVFPKEKTITIYE